jgi:hypothetical protein
MTEEKVLGRRMAWAAGQEERMKRLLVPTTSAELGDKGVIIRGQGS